MQSVTSTILFQRISPNVDILLNYIRYWQASGESNFPNISINRIIKNPIYTGIIRNGKAQPKVIPELHITDPETFERAQKIMTDRTTQHTETPLNLKGQSGQDTNAITMCAIRESVTGNRGME